MAQNTTECQEIPRSAEVLEDIYLLGSLVSTPRPIQTLTPDVATGVGAWLSPVPIRTGAGPKVEQKGYSPRFTCRILHKPHSQSHEGGFLGHSCGMSRSICYGAGWICTILIHRGLIAGGYDGGQDMRE
jgi:hypothetical protein